MQSAAMVICALALVGVNLRASLMAVTPLLPAIQSDLQLSAAHAGLVISLPVLLLGLAPAVSGRLAHSISACSVVALSMAGACLGIVLRSLAGAGPLGLPCFVLGTAVLGTCLGAANATLPAIIKRLRPPSQVAAAGLLNVTLCLGGALAASVSPMMSGFLGNRWAPALAVWAIPAAVCAAVWWRLHGVQQAPSDLVERPARLSLSPLAIALGLNMAAQSFLSQATTTWLPTVLVSDGLTRQDAGGFLATLMVAQLLTALFGPWVANRMSSQRAVMASMYGLGLAGFAGCTQLHAPWNWCAAVLLGLGQGGTFSVALHLIVLRAENSADARVLGFSTQLLGYTISASAPFLFGMLRDQTHSWSFALPAYFLVTLLGLRAAHAAAAPPRPLLNESFDIDKD